MKIFASILSVLLCSLAFAAEGDTTLIAAHHKTDMTWYKSYKEWAVFPDSNFTSHKILMEYTLGCASGGCSDWDYTTLVNLWRKTGRLDSTIASIDTVSTSPMVIDTTWNVFDEKEAFELAKVITPYGGGLANTWTRTFYFDVTDYYPLMRDSVEIEVFYQGWSSGFSATINFIMIEGTPPRDVHQINNLYRTKFNYLNSNQVESTYLPERTVNVHHSARQFGARVAPSGHGFVNSLNCAEFCEKDYYVKVNGTPVAQQAMWRNDCGANDLWPQAGTWLLDRANWCPGDRVTSYDHDLTNHISGSTAQIDVDIEAYSYTVPSGETPANYNFSAQFFQYGDFNHQLDAEISEIISPNDADEYARQNPICQEAVIRIKNKGAQNLTSIRVHYGVEGSLNWKQFQWSGNLAPLESEVLILPMDEQSQWGSLNSGGQIFTAFISEVNGSSDDVAFNNKLSARFTPTPKFPANMRFDLRTNNAASETHWELIDRSSGTVVSSRDGLSNGTFYRDTFNLQPGCYKLSIYDRDEDGLAFFANNDGNGSAALRNIGGTFFNHTINPNFGTEYSVEFTVGYGISLPENEALSNRLSVFPNPSNGEFTLKILGNGSMVYHYEVTQPDGRTIARGTFTGVDEIIETLRLDENSGVYLLKVQSETEVVSQRLIVH